MTALGCSDESVSTSFVRNVDATSQPIMAAVHSNRAIASKLAGALDEHSGNLFYSPLSIEAVSGILYAASAGETAAQLGVLLDAEADQNALHKGLGALLGDLSRKHPNYTLSVANRLWAVPGLRPHQTFVDITRNDYDAPTANVNFAEDADGARSAINNWVSEETSGRIPELLQQGQVTTDTLMAVVNAIYFKADWATVFDASLTRTDKFHKADGTDVSVQMMKSKGVFRVKVDGEARWLELPYRTGDISFLAYMKSSSSVHELQTDLAEADLNEVVASLEDAVVLVEMPRFSMRSRLNLVPVFKQLGVTDLFDAGRANLTNMGASGDVHVDPFVHEAAIWVDEQGTIATAATGGGAELVSVPPVLRFDRPFVFVIRDNLTGAILFSGRVADPSAGAAN